MELEVRYVTTTDGVRVAYANAGNGPPLVTFADPIAFRQQVLRPIMDTLTELRQLADDLTAESVGMAET